MLTLAKLKGSWNEKVYFLKLHMCMCLIPPRLELKEIMHMHIQLSKEAENPNENKSYVFNSDFLSEI